MQSHASPLIRRFRWASLLALVAGLIGGCQNSGPSGSGADAQGVGVTIAPRNAAVKPGAQQNFLATVTGSANGSVTWTVPDASCGTITSSGTYTAPGTQGTCRVMATSNADPAQSAIVTVSVTTEPASTTMNWQPLKVGAGGWVTGIDADRSGATYVLRTDTYGAYVGDGTGPWQQVVNATSMPASFVESFTQGSVQGLGQGVYEIRVAPSSPSTIYMMFNGQMWVSTNRGTSWTQLTNFPALSTLPDPNDSYRMWGEKMAVDPANPNVVYVGTLNGLYVTTNGGSSWSPVSTLGAPGAQGFTGIVFDSSGGTTGGMTNIVYAVKNGTGVYQTTNAGGTWTLLSGGPTVVTHGAVSTDGYYYAATGSSGLVYVYHQGAWTSADTGLQTCYNVASDPTTPARVVAGRDSGHVSVSTNHGAAWAGAIWSQSTAATDVPWLAVANGNSTYMSAGRMMFDPVAPNKLWLSAGIGVWWATSWTGGAQTTWNSTSAGIEQLVGRDISVPPGSPNVFTAGMDRSVFVIPKANTAYPSSYVTMGSTNSLIAAWSIDYSRSNPQHMVALINHGIAGEPTASGYTLDGGTTWTSFPSQPGPNGSGGDIISVGVDSSNSIAAIIAVVGTQYAYRSTDQGNTWTALSLPGDSGANSTNLHCGYDCNKHILAVDGANPSTVYLYFYGHGVYSSVNAGNTWTLVAPDSTFSTAGGNLYWQTRLRSVPGQAGHLFLTAGQAGGNGNQNPQGGCSLYHSTDGGTSWTTVNGMMEVYDVAAGAPAPGHTYPAIYAAGWYNGTYGIWRANDFDVNPTNPTWTDVGPFPFGSVDEITALGASQDVYGDIYAAFSGSGWAYGSGQ